MKAPHLCLVYILFVCGCVSTERLHALGESEGNRIEVKREIYLLIGQSNMAGRAPIRNEDEGAIEGCALYDREGYWDTATNPLNRYSSVRKRIDMQKLGPGYGFAERLRELRPDRPIGLVVNARGGTKIDAWAKGTLYFEEAVRRALEAAQTGTIKGIVWHQGESNSNDEKYLEKLVQLVRDLRESLGTPNLPFVAGMVEGERFVNSQIAKLDESLPFCGVVSSEGLETIDGTHFDSDSARLLGARLAEALVPLLD